MVVFHFGKLGFIGSGTMATALISSLIKDGYTDIIASRKDPAKRDEFRKKYGIETSLDNAAVIRQSDVIILCVKPKDMETVLGDVRAYAAGKLWVSIAAGKTLSYLSDHLGKDTRIIRTMPNLGSLVGFGGTAYVMNGNCTDVDKAIVEYLFSRGGIVQEVEERSMDAVTYIGCKIGLLSKELEQDSTMLAEHGLDTEKSRVLFANALRTMAAYLEQGEDFDVLYKKVASKDGATEAAHLKALELGHYENMKKIAEAALKRCEELRK